jgi:hypothetical protein
VEVLSVRGVRVEMGRCGYKDGILVSMCSCYEVKIRAFCIVLS